MKSYGRHQDVNTRCILEDNTITDNSETLKEMTTGKSNATAKPKKVWKDPSNESSNHLNALINNGPSRASKTKVRAGIQKVSYEFYIIKKIITSLIEAIALGEEGGKEIEEKDINAVIESLENELEEISEKVHEVVDAAKTHVAQRVDDGSEDSISVNSDLEESETSLEAFRKSNLAEQRRREVADAKLRFERLAREQKDQEDLRKQTAALEPARQRTEEARKIAGLNEDRVKLAKSETTKTFEAGTKRFSNNDLSQYVASQPVRVTPIKLKGVALPVFSRDDKMEYEPWKAAFMSVVDEAQITVKEKMLRLQDSL